MTKLLEEYGPMIAQFGPLIIASVALTVPVINFFFSRRLDKLKKTHTDERIRRILFFETLTIDNQAATAKEFWRNEAAIAQRTATPQKIIVPATLSNPQIWFDLDSDQLVRSVTHLLEKIARYNRAVDLFVVVTAPASKTKNAEAALEKVIEIPGICLDVCNLTEYSEGDNA